MEQIKKEIKKFRQVDQVEEYTVMTHWSPSTISPAEHELMVMCPGAAEEIRVVSSVYGTEDENADIAKEKHLQYVEALKKRLEGRRWYGLTNEDGSVFQLRLVEKNEQEKYDGQVRLGKFVWKPIDLNLVRG